VRAAVRVPAESRHWKRHDKGTSPPFPGVKHRRDRLRPRRKRGQSAEPTEVVARERPAREPSGRDEDGENALKYAGAGDIVSSAPVVLGSK